MHPNLSMLLKLPNIQSILSLKILKTTFLKLLSSINLMSNKSLWKIINLLGQSLSLTGILPNCCFQQGSEKKYDY